MNEITAVPELLRTLELASCIVTTAAMDCQKKIATLRRLALNLLKRDKTKKRGICGKQKRASPNAGRRQQSVAKPVVNVHADSQTLSA